MQFEAHDAESRAIARLIEQINSIEDIRDRVGKRIVVLFLCVFGFAVCLLFYFARDPQAPVVTPTMGKPVPGVLRQHR